MTGERAVDAAIIGGGLTGLALATALGQGGVDVLVVERAPLERLASPAFDGRVTAVARGSKLLLDGIGVWGGLAAEAEPILDIVVGEAGSRAQVRYDHRDVGHEPLGWIVENRVLREALMARLALLPNVELAAPARIRELERGTAIARLGLEDGRRYRTPLVVAAEGKESATRQAAGIGARRWDYGQTGIVCTLVHTRPHHGLAVERFFPDGPFALLPLTGNRSSIVWALQADRARTVTALDDAAFLGEVAERTADGLGELALEGPRWHYPLGLVWADRYVDRRLALVGDSARGIHPIAGQGWNLALRDVAAVAELVVDRVRLGLDPGDDATLARYAAWRGFDSLVLVAVTDGINRLFANDLFPLEVARNAGLALVERVPAAKRFFMRHAMGLVGDLPRLMRGLPL
ncbi:MAG TPA: UbiH/UbiF/VisC/COQ6 family ubiquinone biosynthesis hydroxylase [Geminicoccaceae bacterium]|nr:UbiH/UbiF/VisC/COQ6 family ubiquinone biosynthesis hydroxylase [Geminicoccus sp.]HMU50672.1 UbiH/UbiF/VisC/COQ6 family ubiquinone biosynthesis hydroxylase [Geminicoccaceae bacterium]